MRYLEVDWVAMTVHAVSASVDDLHDRFHGFECRVGFGEHVTSDFFEAEFADGKYVFGDLL
jgi:hypothetical protein